MEPMTQILQGFQAMPFAVPAAIAAPSLLFLLSAKDLVHTKKNDFPELPSVPAVPGLPVVGNLLQLKEKKPYKTFTKWAEEYGPIYSIRTGASTMVVLNSTDIAKEVSNIYWSHKEVTPILDADDLISINSFQKPKIGGVWRKKWMRKSLPIEQRFCQQKKIKKSAMVTRYSSMSTKKLSKALKLLTFDKCMVAISDYDDFHKMIKRYILTNVLGVNAQKRHGNHRDTMRENVASRLHAHVKNSPQEAINFRKIFESELFGIALKQAIGKNIEDSIYVEELGTTLSRDEIFKVLVFDIMEGAIEVDWRDFFPYLSWVPNKAFENKIQRLCSRRKAVMNALIEEQKKRIASGEELDCYIDYLLSEAKTLTPEQISMLIWETIIETADTTLVTTEWAMYELAKDRKRQDRLFEEIQNVCGTDKITEEHLSQMPYLGAVFHETLRKHSPAPIVPLRYVHEDTQLGGYYVPVGTEIAINIYGCNMDKNQWESPEEWKPERFLDPKYDPMDLYKTMAFGTGKRVCAGSLQAMLIACTTIGRLVQEFEWKLRDGEEENVDTVGLTTHKLHPMHAVLKPRN